MQKSTAAREAAGDWQAAFDAIGTGILILDADLKVLCANRTLAGWLGALPAALAGRPCCELLHGTDAPPKSCPACHAVRSGHEEHVELEIPLLGGFYRCSAYPQIEDGAVKRIVQVVDDVTERRRVDGDLRLQTEYLAVLHETALGLIARRDLPSLLSTIVERAAALLGAPHGFLYLLEPGAGEMVLQVGLGAYAAHLGSQLCRGQGLAGRVWQTGRSLVVAGGGDDPAREEPGGAPRRSRVAVPLLAEGQVAGVLGLAADEETDRFHFDEIALLSRFAELASIAVDNARLYEAVQRELAERRLAEESLRRSEARYRTLFESAGDAILIYELNGRLLAANLLACDRLGYELEELLQMAPADLEAPPYAGWFKERMEELRLHGHHFFETVHLRSDGTPIPTELSSRLIEYEGGLAVLAIARDVTERRQMEQRLLHTERLAAMGQLAAALAHEINNPLQSIGSSIELVLDYPLGDAEREEYLEAVRQEVRRLMDVTGRVLDFARPPRAERQPVSAADVVRYALALAEKQLEQSHIDVRLDFPEELPLIHASHGELAQVFLNLTINAIEAMPGGGRLCIGARAAGNAVEVVFDDTGAGLSPAALETLFQPFHTTKEYGTGLGLAVSYNIVQQQGGSIAAANAPTGGAVFTVSLPLAPGQEAR